MTYTFGDFIGLLILAWIFAFALHQTIGGLMNIFFRGVEKKNKIVVDLKDRP